MANKWRISEYVFNGSETLILDTNILLYLFGPYNGSEDYGYSDFLEDILNKKCKLVVSDVILSEFVNRNLRLAYSTYIKDNNLNSRRFKYKRDYRETSDFAENYELSLEIIRTEILTIAELVEISIEDMENSVSTNYAMLDYNDEIILRTAERNDYGIATHDSDFFKQETDVLIFSTNLSE